MYNTNISVNANYANYIVYILVVILLTLILLRTAASGMQYGGGHKSVNNTWILLIAIGVISGFVFANAFFKTE
jgi:glycopeptide antibiotics resistance protein